MGDGPTPNKFLNSNDAFGEKVDNVVLSIQEDNEDSVSSRGKTQANELSTRRKNIVDDIDNSTN
jgi:hypothetical protein